MMGSVPGGCACVAGAGAALPLPTIGAGALIAGAGDLLGSEAGYEGGGAGPVVVVGGCDDCGARGADNGGIELGLVVGTGAVGFGESTDSMPRGDATGFGGAAAAAADGTAFGASCGAGEGCGWAGARTGVWVCVCGCEAAGEAVRAEAVGTETGGGGMIPFGGPYCSIGRNTGCGAGGFGSLTAYIVASKMCGSRVMVTWPTLVILSLEGLLGSS